MIICIITWSILLISIIAAILAANIRAKTYEQDRLGNRVFTVSFLLAGVLIVPAIVFGVLATENLMDSGSKAQRSTLIYEALKEEKYKLEKYTDADMSYEFSVECEKHNKHVDSFIEEVKQNRKGYENIFTNWIASKAMYEKFYSYTDARLKEELSVSYK